MDARHLVFETQHPSCLPPGNRVLWGKRQRSAIGLRTLGEHEVMSQLYAARAWSSGRPWPFSLDHAIPYKNEVRLWWLTPIRSSPSKARSLAITPSPAQHDGNDGSFQAVRLWGSAPAAVSQQLQAFYALLLLEAAAGWHIALNARR